MEQFVFIILGTGGGSLLGWMLSSLITTGKYVNRIDNLEKVAHRPPCDSLSEIKTDIGEIKTDIKWLKRKYNGDE